MADTTMISTDDLYGTAKRLIECADLVMEKYGEAEHSKNAACINLAMAMFKLVDATYDKLGKIRFITKDMYMRLKGLHEYHDEKWFKYMLQNYRRINAWASNDVTLMCGDTEYEELRETTVDLLGFFMAQEVHP